MELGDGGHTDHCHGINRWFNPWNGSLGHWSSNLRSCRKETLGRVFNVLGDTIDLDQPLLRMLLVTPSTKKAPSFDELSTSEEILETGDQGIDLLAPYLKGGKVGLFGGAGVGKTV